VSAEVEEAARDAYRGEPTIWTLAGSEANQAQPLNREEMLEHMDRIVADRGYPTQPPLRDILDGV
jgi:hypothetical protein